ncbi:MAG: tetratricopeptide repeat protein [Anaerolineaceae bacterium]|nr:tetratricopeptide repeat protein [Anaerolineaceae bacterium]
MMTSNHIIDVNELDFEYEVLNFSQNTPVVVEFWAKWSRSGKDLRPILESIANQSRGAFRLARVDVDSNPNLALRFNVRTIPTVKAFSQGQVVMEFVDFLPELKVREFISKISPPSPLSLSYEKAESYLLQHDWKLSEEIFLEIISHEPDKPEALLGLSKSYLGMGKPFEAEKLLSGFPACALSNSANLLYFLAQAWLDHDFGVLDDESDLDAAFQNCLRLARRRNIPAALDGLIDILRLDRHYKNDSARQIILALLELLGKEDPLTRQYRKELASVLF